MSPIGDVPGFPILHPEGGARLGLARSARWRIPSRLCLALGLFALPWNLAAGSGFLALAAAGFLAGRSAAAGYERGLLWRGELVPWERVDGLGLVGDVLGARLRSGTREWTLVEEDVPGFQAWLESEYRPRRGRELLTRIRGGERVQWGDPAQATLVRRGIEVPGRGVVSWSALGPVRTGEGSIAIEVEAGAGAGTAILLDAGVPDAGALVWVLERAPVLAWFQAASATEESRGIPADPGLLTALAELEVPEACCRLGLARLAEPGSRVSGRSWLERAVAGGDPEAARELGRDRRARARSAFALEAAVALLTRAGEAGDGEAALDLGFHHEIGEGTAASPVRAEEWYRRAVEAGGAESVASAREVAAARRFREWTAAFEADRRLPGWPTATPTPGSGELLFAQSDADLGDRFEAYPDRLVGAETVIPLDAFTRIEVQEEGEGRQQAVRLRLVREQETMEVRVGMRDPRNRFLRFAFEEILAERVAVEMSGLVASGRTLHLGSELQVSLDRDGIQEEVLRRGTPEIERVDWTALEAMTLGRGRVHVVASRTGDEPRASVSMGLEEANAHVLVRIVRRRLANRSGTREAEEADPPGQ